MHVVEDEGFFIHKCQIIITHGQKIIFTFLAAHNIAFCVLQLAEEASFGHKKRRCAGYFFNQLISVP